MNKIINGKRYDTDKAKEVGSWEASTDPGAFNYYCETLYRKRTGEFFLHGEGGPRTPYADFRADGSIGWGEQLRPMAYDVAAEWAERHLTADEYEAVFGPVDEEAGNEPVTLSLPAGAKARLKAMSSQTGETQSAIVGALIGAGIKAGAEREMDIFVGKDGSPEAAQCVRLDHLTRGRIAELEEIRGIDLYDHGNGECYEVVMLSVYQDDGCVDLRHASVVGVFKTHAEAAEYLKKKVSFATFDDPNCCTRTAHFIRYHRIPVE